MTQSLILTAAPHLTRELGIGTVLTRLSSAAVEETTIYKSLLVLPLAALAANALDRADVMSVAILGYN